MKRSIPVLSQKDLRKFVQFCSEERSSGDFEIYLGLGKLDVQFYKTQLNIDSPSDAKELLKNVFALQEKERAIREEERRIINDQKQKDVEQRFEQQQTELRDTIKKHTKVTPLQAQKTQQRQQKRLDKQNSQKTAINKKGWKLPIDQEGLTPERFRHEICVLGMRFVKDKYGVSKEEIVNEANRLKLKIDFEIIPR